MVKIAIALPVPNLKIIGGYKVIYEYANYLAEKGCDITIIYNAHNGDNSINMPRFFAYLIRWNIGTFGPPWFKLNPKIHKKVFPSFGADTFNAYDVVVATATETAEYVNMAKIKSENKWYFVQGFEDWGRSKDEVIKTFCMDMNIITISKWLERIINEVANKDVIYIPNGIDNNDFYVRIPYQKRGIHTLSTLFHWDERKRCDIALRVIYRLKERYIDFEAYLFGSPPRRKEWPEWIHYVQKAMPKEVCETMNMSRVFLCASSQEGFGLTGIESMFCGCTLVTTDCEGIREYATEKNAYLCAIDDEDALFESICRAFDSEDEAAKKREHYRNILNGFDIAISKEAFYQAVVGENK